jgi:hypothetical protein
MQDIRPHATSNANYRSPNAFGCSAPSAKRLATHTLRGLIGAEVVNLKPDFEIFEAVQNLNRLLRIFHYGAFGYLQAQASRVRTDEEIPVTGRAGSTCMLTTGRRLDPSWCHRITARRV